MTIEEQNYDECLSLAKWIQTSPQYMAGFGLGSDEALANLIGRWLSADEVNSAPEANERLVELQVLTPARNKPPSRYIVIADNDSTHTQHDSLDDILEIYTVSDLQDNYSVHELGHQYIPESLVEWK